MGGSAFLREFSSPETVAPIPSAAGDEESIREEAYARGVEDGTAQARRAIDLETLEAVRDLAATLDNLTALQEQVRVDMAAEAGVALSSVVRALAPGLSVLGLAGRARELLENELRDAPRPLAVSAAPDVVERLRMLVRDMPEPDFSIKADEAIPATRIEASWPEGQAIIDVDALVSTIMGLANDLTPDTAPEAGPEEEIFDD